jgi:mRNA-degrading endonuclease toxin of MazEF toxin-antitoxin module
MSQAKSPKRGEIWWVDLPNQPRDPHQPRTAIIVSPNKRNELACDVIVVPTFSNIRPHTTHVTIPAGVGGMPHESVAKCEQISTLDKQLLADGPLGPPISKALMQSIVRAVRCAIDDPPLP